MEMLIVLSIVGLLMGLVIANMSGFHGVAEEQKARADILTYRNALTAYQIESGTLPTAEQGLKALVSKPTIEPIPARWHAIAESLDNDPWGHPYQYLNPGKHNPDKYDVFSMGPDGVPGTDDDIGNWKDKNSQ